MQVSWKKIRSFINQEEEYIELENNTKIFSNIIFENFKIDIHKSNSTIENDDFKCFFSSQNGRINLENIIFRKCKFTTLEIFSILSLNIVFEDCEIAIFQMNNLEYNKKYNSIQINGGKIINCNIKNSEIAAKFYINKQCDDNRRITKIGKLSIKNTIFEENFKLHRCEVGIVEIEDTDFKKNADFFMSVFKEGTLVESEKENISKNDIGFKAINFDSLALFGDTEFHKKFIFKYVTFKGHNHFKSAELYKGLDLEYTNIQNEINFYGLNILDTSTTSQETYRIIKHQFEKLGNKIEANKYHALELEQRRKNLKKEKKSFSNYLERIVFFFHHWSSWHSTNWAFPIFWIFILSFLTHFLVDNFVCYKCTHHSNWLDYFRYMSIVNLDDCLKYNPLIFLFNKVTLGYLYYQFLTSVRKDTRK